MQSWNWEAANGVAAKVRRVKSLHICVKRVDNLFLPVASTPRVPNITVVRRNNVVTLFQQFAEDQMRAGIAPKGLEQAFAQRLQISPSMWSQIKSSRPIGDKLARQIEATCRQTGGWLDEERAAQGLTPSEQLFLATALKAWRATNADGRKRLKDLMKSMAG